VEVKCGYDISIYRHRKLSTSRYFRPGHSLVYVCFRWTRHDVADGRHVTHAWCVLFHLSTTSFLLSFFISRAAPMFLGRVYTKQPECHSVEHTLSPSVPINSENPLSIIKLIVVIHNPPKCKSHGIIQGR